MPLPPGYGHPVIYFTGIFSFSFHKSKSTGEKAGQSEVIYNTALENTEYASAIP